MSSKKELNNGKYIDDQMGNGVIDGGISGQILAKNSDSDYDLVWIPNAGAGKVGSVTATSPITSSGGTSPNISTSMNTNKLIGRGSASVGVMEEITIGSGLILSGTTLSSDTSIYVPYIGATGNVNLGTHSIIMDNTTYNSEMSPSYFGVENASATKYGLLEYNQLTISDTTISSSMAITATGITFPNSSTQTIAFVDAPSDGTTYGRKNGAWSVITASVGFEMNFLLMGA
jgi:hypothetical protein